MRFADLVDLFERISATTKRLEIRSLLAEHLRGVSEKDVGPMVYLLQGQLRPEYEGLELGVADSLARRAVASVLDKRLIIGILGKDVKSAKGEDMGRIVDVIVDRSGQTRAAIIDFGGFLGVGSRRIAVDWNALHFEPQQKGDQIALDLTRDQVRAAPEYKEDKPVVVLGPSGAAEPIPDN